MSALGVKSRHSQCSARPGGNATGTTILAIELEGKRLRLHELVPTTATMAALVNPKNPSADTKVKNFVDAARSLGRQIRILHAVRESEIDAAFKILAQEGAGALTLGGGDTYFRSRRNHLVTLANHYAIPTMY